MTFDDALGLIVLFIVLRAVCREYWGYPVERPIKSIVIVHRQDKGDWFEEMFTKEEG
jgi:hypothetical protein